MRIFQVFLEIRQQVTLRGFPIKERIKASIRSREECEVVLSDLYSFWRDVSCPIYWGDVVEYQVSVLRFQVRLQKSGHVRMIHQYTADGRLLLDLVVLFNYGFSPVSYDYCKEMAEVQHCFGKVPNDLYKRKDRAIVPVIVFDNSRVLIERDRVSRVEAVPGGLMEIDELFL